MNKNLESSTVQSAMNIVLNGHVQGVGMRPAIARLANKSKLCGYVRNGNDGVIIRVEGPKPAVTQFCDNLLANLPVESCVTSARLSAYDFKGYKKFTIDESQSNVLQINTKVPLDCAICTTCKKEILDQNAHRFQYPFTSCTDCGPRYSIVDSMPFDRRETSMRCFPLCSCCSNEYESLNDRRFHAQTIACSNCGPKLQYRNTEAKDSFENIDPLTEARNAIRSGKIIAVKGLGGYQLICDATSDTAVERLRQIKRRRCKAFAIMVASIEAANGVGDLLELEEAMLLGTSNPIVLVKENGKNCISNSVNPNLNRIGIMLPTTPLHELLLNGLETPCVVTSANTNGEPLIYEDEEILRKLDRYADGCLFHDRNIIRPIDDSVVLCANKKSVTIRAARGIAPYPLKLKTSRSILATGGHQKVAVGLSNGSQSLLGPHVGDMNSIASRDRFCDQVSQLTSLYQSNPEAIAHDLHPDYFTTQWATEQSVTTIGVQHHHAHIVSGMVEQGWLDEKVFGIAFDGTGYGTDGTIWGGEFLLCTQSSFERVARLLSFPMYGGELAIQQPWRTAFSLIQLAKNTSDTKNELRWVQAQKTVEQLSKLADNKNQTRIPHQKTSSMGRLFDGVAALIFEIDEVGFEGEAAMRLEAKCNKNATGEYSFEIIEGTPIEIDWRPMIREILDDKKRRENQGNMAMKFTRTVARMVESLSLRFRDYPIIMSGGCFQNTLLLEESVHLLKSHRMKFGANFKIPPNDGGLAVGQLAVAAALLERKNIASKSSSRGEVSCV